MEGRGLEQAYRYCEWITARHYENFPVASRLLPAGLRPHVAAVYAFARSADDFADESKYQGRSLELLGRWRQALSVIASGAKQSRDCGADPSPVVEIASGAPCPRNDVVGDLRSHPIFLALANTVRAHHLPPQLLDDLLTAFRMDVTKRRYASWEELLTYCRYSANPVGRLVLLLSGIREEELHRRSDDICTGLQLTNHWQDLKLDLARGILYVPQALLAEHGVTEQELNGPLLRPEVRALMAELVRRSRALFDSGEALLRHVSAGLRLELKLTLLGGRGILDRIEAARYDVFTRRPVLSSLSKLGLLLRAAIS